MKNVQDRPDLIAGCARDALKDVPEELVREAYEKHSGEFRSAREKGLTDTQTHELLLKEPC
ncbi:MAG: hypothetical protein J5822_03975 [Eubacteriaceae bacterium]|nr:hypothetical protein [Eubacteriaceae bacterium]